MARPGVQWTTNAWVPSTPTTSVAVTRSTQHVTLPGIAELERGRWTLEQSSPPGPAYGIRTGNRRDEAAMHMLNSPFHRPISSHSEFSTNFGSPRSVTPSTSSGNESHRDFSRTVTTNSSPVARLSQVSRVHASSGGGNEEDAIFVASISAHGARIAQLARLFLQTLGHKPSQASDARRTKHTRDEKDRRDLHRQLLEILNTSTKEILPSVRAGYFDQFGIDSQLILDAADCHNKKQIITKTSCIMSSILKILSLDSEFLKERNWRRQLQIELQALQERLHAIELELQSLRTQERHRHAFGQRRGLDSSDVQSSDVVSTPVKRRKP